MFTKEEIKLMLEALNALPINSNVASLREGSLKINPIVENLIVKLMDMQDAPDLNTTEPDDE